MDNISLNLKLNIPPGRGDKFFQTNMEGLANQLPPLGMSMAAVASAPLTHENLMEMQKYIVELHKILDEFYQMAELAAKFNQETMKPKENAPQPAVAPTPPQG
jgi:hypothetical protein